MNRPVAVVTGGGAGIGAAIADALGRRGAYVVTVDPMLTLDGAGRLDEQPETAADRVVAASVTDRAAVDELFAELERVDVVVNVAGISRTTGFAHGADDDWRSVLDVHLGGYLNVLSAALPRMAAAGHGRILGVTSGGGWRPADAGAYSCAKRAVAALTWQLAAGAPNGVTVNALSPLAVTRMVTAALERAGGSTGPTAASGGLSFGSMQGPEALAPLAAHLVLDDVGWCNGQVVFTNGPEAAVVQPPRLLEAVRTDGIGAVDDFVARALVPAEAAQASGGGTNPRFPDLFGTPPARSTAVTTCQLVTDRPGLRDTIASALERRGIRCTDADADAVVVAMAGTAPSGTGWEAVLAEHVGVVDQIHDDARRARAVADAGRPIRLVTLTDAVSAGGRSRAQAAAQLSRVGHTATDDRVRAFAVALEADEARVAQPAAELVAALLAGDDTTALAGAELVVGDGWLGLRSHPRVAGSVTFGGPDVPDWFDDVLRQLVGP